MGEQINYTAKNGILNSVYPCTEYLTFGPWIYMVPQFKPKSVLLLGYCGGTVAGLMRKLYGDIEITAVDINFIDDRYNVNFVEADAKEYVKGCGHFEATVVDLYEDGNPEPCDFVLAREFVEDLKKITDYAIIHTSPETDMSAYGEEYLVKKLQLNNSVFYYFMFHRVARLPIR